jgi:SAM-dependent methyltransferase
VPAGLKKRFHWHRKFKFGYENKIKGEKKMETTHHDEIRQAVREAYKKVAKASTAASRSSQAAACCGPSDNLTEANPGSSCGCCGPGLSLEQLSSAIGYTIAEVDSVPEGSNMGLGCGNPVALASLKPGETVVDLGSGGGFDCFLAAKQVGETGRVIGVDMTPEMVSKARKNAEKMGTGNVEFRLGEIENLPVGDNSVDIVMSNCVVNLSPDKLEVYRDAYRVLKPGGRLAISDILATAPLPEEFKANLALLAACVGGAETFGGTEQVLRKAGFKDITIKPNNNSRKLLREWNPAISNNAADYVVSATIEAVKRI